MDTGLDNYEAFARSLRNFQSWLGDEVSGGMDIDFLCERRGNFLVVEGKPWRRGVAMRYGQHRALYMLSQQPKTRLYLVGEDGNRLHMLCYNTAPAPKVSRFKGAGPMAYFVPELFIPSDRDGLRSLVKAWWEDHS